MIAQICTGTPAFLNFTATPMPTALPARKAVMVEIVNDTQSDLTVDRGVGTAFGTLKAGNSHIFKLKASTAELRLSVVEGEATPGIIECWG